MATRWKRFVSSWPLRAAAFVLAVLCVTGSIRLMWETDKLGLPLSAAFTEDYRQSTQFLGERDMLERTAAAILTRYISEDNIRAGGTATVERLRSEMEQHGSSGLYIVRPDDSEQEYRGVYTVEELLPLLTDRGRAALEDARQAIIREDLTAWKDCFARLDGQPGFYYFISNGTVTYTNTPDTSRAFFERQPSYSYFDLGKTEQYPAPERYMWGSSLESASDNRLSPLTDQIFIAFGEDYFTLLQAEWDSEQDLLVSNLSALAVLGLIALALVVYLIAVTGRGRDGAVHLCTLDGLFTDVLAVLLFFIVVIVAGLTAELPSNAALDIGIPIAALVLSVTLLVGLLSLVRHIKTRTLLRGTLIYWVFRRLAGLVRTFLCQKPYTQKMIWITIGYSVLLCLSVIIFPVAIALIAFAVWYIIKKSRDFNAVADGARRIRAGELEHKIEVSDKSELAALAADINAISDGLDNAIAAELKSERLKTELITNVSHDIRTPLTSIITYVDLLKKEGPGGENATRYLDVLEQKAARLKTLTDDLFDAAKATSGNVEAHMEKVDVCALLTQGLGELDEKIKASGLDFRSHMPGTLYVQADGKLLWRILENLIVNVLKYALPGSRVYIDAAQEANSACLTIKNISARELNVDPDELLLRFKRGDEARHTEGSGLGLAIAKSLAEAQGGTLALQIDGDLFKAILTLRAWDIADTPQPTAP